MTDHVKLHIRKRVMILFLIVVFLLFSLFLRLVWVQVVSSGDYQNRAMAQRLREQTVEPKRGLILDRNGEALVVSGTAETIVALPPEIKDPEKTAQLLQPYSTLQAGELLRRLKAERSSMNLDRKVSPEIAQKIKQLNLPGIISKPEASRYYPKGELAAHILGFSGTDGDGLEGLEKTMDRYLGGIPGQMAVEKDARGRELPNSVQEYYPPQDGYNIFLTIDHVIQYIAERELERGMTKVKADGGSVIVMDPQTGEILALANWPTYNPNVFHRYSHNDWRNVAVSNIYEPGSTFKIVTAAAALEEGVVNVNDKFFCNGSIMVADARIGCWEEQGHGSQTFAQVVENSCNPGFVQVGQRLGAESFYKYIDAFGFGKKTGIPLSGEEKGMLYSLPQIGPVELATLSFGHSISVTPIQLITAVSAIANDGLLLRPRLVREVRDQNGNIIEKFEPEPIRQVVSKETAQLARRLLGDVVEEGTGKNAQVEGYEIGGKTGTAQLYGKSAYDASFIGFVPVDKPRLVILVVLYHVTSYPHFGSQTAAPIFQKVAKDVLRHLQIPPQNMPNETKNRTQPNKITVPNLRNLSVDEAREKLAKLGFGFKVEGSGDQVIEQVPLPGAVMNDHSTVIIFTQDGLTEKKRYQVTVPNVKGMQVKDAANLLAELGLRITSSNNQGKIYNQIPVPYLRVDSGTEVKVFTQ